MMCNLPRIGYKRALGSDLKR